ncbi:PTS transporter subunit EIIC [Heyndrickxia acidicola]|uniref:PTS transporter subunit EIIC n=1 Tax=Heyndrickxia acidicola TaxID=209389 RepID=A0ABU6MDW8_9BACI|nr:PTS transporter subunit EIIC [Heyndrickxia acidicola]MED1202846.1 PTS transporter subunit EIIC [Heyndrickxia acidicola]
MKKEQQIAEGILLHVGGKENLRRIAHCMTRIRLDLKDHSIPDLAAIKAVEGVMGVIEDETLQIVVGPGTVNKVAAEMSRITGLQVGEEAEPEPDQLTLEEKGALKKENLKRKNNTPFKNLLRKIGNIFIPLIPGIVASGIINGAANFMSNAHIGVGTTWMQILLLIGGGVFTYLGILVGWNTAKEFGGTPVLGAIAGILLFNPGLANIHVYGHALIPGRGGLFGVIFAAWLMTVLEKQIRKIMPNTVDIIFTPLITVLIVGILSIYVVQPVFGVIADGITNGVKGILDVGGPLAGALLAGFFLPLVMLGLHQGLTPIHMQFISTYGNTPLLPVLAMAGGGQVGAALAIFVKTKNKKLKNIIKGGLPAGLLGIGEPLLYGVTVPLGRPFITACIGAAFGGAFQAALKTASTAIGVSGLSLTPLIAHNQYVVYLIGLVIAYVFGFLFTYFFGFKEEMADNIR